MQSVVVELDETWLGKMVPSADCAFCPAQFGRCLGCRGCDNRFGVGDSVSQATFNLRFADNRSAALLFGPQGDHLTLLERLLDVQIVSRGSSLAVSGAP